MITRYYLKLNETLQPSAAYLLYAALLEHTPKAFGDWVHECAVTPVSQYISADQWCVSLLGERCEDVLEPVLEQLDSLTLHKQNKTIEIIGRSVQYVRSVEELLSSALPSKLTLYLKTATAFKSKGAYQLLPTQRLLVQSLISKWNGCLGDVCPIEDDGEGLDALAEGLVYHAIHLDSARFPIKQTLVPGATGKLQAQNRLDGFHKQLMDALLTFGTFSGVGIKTALGMGGFDLKQAKEKV